MKPDIILVEPMMAPIEAALDANYQVHRLFQADNPAALLAEVGPKVRAVVTGGGTGVSSTLFDGLPISASSPSTASERTRWISTGPAARECG